MSTVVNVWVLVVLVALLFLWFRGQS